MTKQIHKIQEKFPKALGHPVFRDPGSISCIHRGIQAIPEWLGESRKSRKGVLDVHRNPFYAWMEGS